MSAHSKKVKALISLFYKLEASLDTRKKLRLLRQFPFKQTLKSILTFVFTPTITLEVDTEFLTKIKPKKKIVNADDRLVVFLSTLKKLVASDISEKKFRKILKSELAEASVEELEVYRRIIRRSLDIGVTQELALVVFPKLITNPTNFMAAEPYNPNTDLNYPVYAEPIIDGVRLKLIASPQGEFFVYNSAYADYTVLFETYRKGLVKLAKEYDSVVELDCIATSKYTPDMNYFNASFYRGHNPPAKDSESYIKLQKNLSLFIFDCIIRSKEQRKLKFRKKDLMVVMSKLGKKTAQPKLVILPFVEIAKSKLVHKAYLKATKKGYSGIVLKSPSSPYTSGTSSMWLAYKDIKRETVKILAVLPSSNPNVEACIGLVVKRHNGTKFVLSGIRDVQRGFLWENRNRVIGNYCEIEAVEATVPGCEGSVQFIKMRWDKKA